MTLPVRIEGHDHANSTITAARVTRTGQLVTASFSYDDTVFNELAVDDTAYNFYKPLAGQQFVITGLVAIADKQVSSTVSAVVVIYEAGSDATTTVDKVLYQTAMVQDQINILIPLNILVNAGKFVNAKTTDDDIHMTIMGYFIPTL